jgi:hypothetical protein
LYRGDSSSIWQNAQSAAGKSPFSHTQWFEKKILDLTVQVLVPGTGTLYDTALTLLYSFVGISSCRDTKSQYVVVVGAFFRPNEPPGESVPVIDIRHI